MRPLLLDLFCGAGGAARGYFLAGFDVIGIDNRPMPRYPYRFTQGDAICFLRDHGKKYDAIHASPPCQDYSVLKHPGNSGKHQRLIESVRQALVDCGVPYVIENVMGAKRELRNPIMLCGMMFGLELYRHRLFECSDKIKSPQHLPHETPCSKAGHWKPGTFVSVCGNCSPIARSREAMGIDWMNRDELAQSIPPAYTLHVGLQLKEYV